MMSLFNSFDLSIYTFYPLMFLILGANFMKKLFKKSMMETLMNMMNLNLMKFFYSLKNKNYNKGMLLLLGSIFLMIMALNLSSILPFVFPVTSQMGSILFMSMTMWITFITFSLSKSMKNLMAHFTPMGSPYPLIPFLFMIEIVSNMIRPITVSVRLMSNILAGHLLMILLAEMVLKNFSLTIIYSLLNLVEMAVAMIQAYIFCTMITLYYSDVV